MVTAVSVRPTFASRFFALLITKSVGAIANYTTRVVSKSLDTEQIQEALKFIGQFFDFF